MRVGFKCIKNTHHMDLWALDSYLKDSGHILEVLKQALI